LLKPNNSAAFAACGFGQLHLAEQGAGDQNRRHAADLGANLFPAPPFFAFDIEQFLGEVGSRHGNLPWRSSLWRTAIAEQLPCHAARALLTSAD
jgi:hypothetical protein